VQARLMKVVYVNNEEFLRHWGAAGGTKEQLDSVRAENARLVKRIAEDVRASRVGVVAPTTAEMAKNFTSSMARWVGAGFKTVDEELYNKRLLTCRECEHWKEAGIGRCMKCGCAGIKLWLATEKCPIDKW